MWCRENSEGAVVVVSYNTSKHHTPAFRHYCERNLKDTLSKQCSQPCSICDGNLKDTLSKQYSQPCSICDGICGPLNGCQCKACAALDANDAPENTPAPAVVTTVKSPAVKNDKKKQGLRIIK